MGLQVKRRSGVSARTTATLMTIMSVFAFVLSPFYGIVADQVASAAETSGLVSSGFANDLILPYGDDSVSVTGEISVQGINEAGVNISVKSDSEAEAEAKIARVSGLGHTNADPSILGLSSEPFALPKSADLTPLNGIILQDGFSANIELTFSEVGSYKYTITDSVSGNPLILDFNVARDAFEFIKVDPYVRTASSRIIADVSFKNYEQVESLKVQLLKDDEVLAEITAKESLLNSVNSKTDRIQPGTSAPFQLPVNTRDSDSWGYDGVEFQRDDVPNKVRAIVKDSSSEESYVETVGLNITTETYNSMIPVPADTEAPKILSINLTDFRDIDTGKQVTGQNINNGQLKFEFTTDEKLDLNNVNAAQRRATLYVGTGNTVLSSSSYYTFAGEENDEFKYEATINLNSAARTNSYEDVRLRFAVSDESGNAKGYIYNGPDNPVKTNVHSVTHRLMIDNTRPTVEIVEPDEDGTFNPDRVVIKAHDNVKLNKLTVNLHDLVANKTRSMTCDTNQASGTDWTRECDLSNLPDGRYKIKANASDVPKNGNSGISATQSRTFIVDHQLPTISNVHIDNLIDDLYVNSKTSGNVLHANVVDKGDAGIASVKYAIYLKGSDGKIRFVNGKKLGSVLSGTMTRSSGDDWTANLDLSSLDDDEYIVAIDVRDKAGNGKTNRNTGANGYVTFIVDKTAPIASNVQLNKIVTVDGVDYTSAKLNGGVLEVTFNTNEPLKLVGSQVGLQVPGLTGVPATGWYKVKEVDASDKLYKVSISLTDYSYNSAEGVVSGTLDGAVFEDVKLYFRLVDTLGNTDSNYYYADGSFGKSPSKAYTFTIDNESPVASISVDSLHSGEFIVTSGVKVTGNVDTSEKIMKSHWLEVTGPDSYVYRAYNLNNPNLSWSFDWDTSELTDGEYTIRYVATDAVENRNDDPGYPNSAKMKVIVNNSTPGAEVTVGDLSNGDTTNDKNIAIKGVGTPSQYGGDINTHFFEIKTPNGTRIVYSDKTSDRCTLNGPNDCVLSLADYFDGDGEYTVRYVVTDQHGHRSDGFKQPWLTGVQTANFTFYVDTAAPDAPEVVSAGPAGASGTAEPGSTVTVFVDGEEVGTAVADEDGNWSVVFDPEYEADGIYNVTATATDAAENTSELSEAVEFRVASADNPSGPAASTPPARPAGGTGLNPGAGVASQSPLLAFNSPVVFAQPADSTDVLGDDTDADDAEGEVKASEDRVAAGVNGDATKNGCFKLLGLCWYYWIPIVIVAIAIIWWLSSRRRDEALV